MKEKKVPQLRFPEFKDDWEQRKLGDEMTVTSVKRVMQSDWTDEGIRFLRARDIVSAAKNEEPSDYLYISKERYENYSALSGKVAIGDILVTGVGTIGIPYLISNSDPIYFKDGNIIWFQNQDKIDGDFFYYSFCGNSIQQFIRSSAGIGTVGTYTIESGKKTPILLPTDAEQKAIAIFFRELDSLITLHQRKLDHLLLKKKSLLQKMFPKEGEKVPELRFSGFTEDWVQRKLSELGNIVTGSTPSTQVTEYYSNTGIPWVTPSDISDNVTYNTEKKLSEKGQQVGRIVPKNTILVTCIASIGKNTMLGVTGSFNQQINGLTPNESKYNPYFLFTESSFWSAKMKKSAAAGMMQIVNRTEFSKQVTMIPSLSEQQQIGALFRDLDDLIDLHQRKLEHLSEQKKTLLQQMFV